MLMKRYPLYRPIIRIRCGYRQITLTNCFVIQTVESFHFDTAGGGEDAAAISATSLAVFLVEFAGVVKDVFTFRL